MSTATLAAPPSLQDRSQDGRLEDNEWLQRSVKEFFSLINWDDRPPAAPPETDPLADLPLILSEPLSLTLTVAEFFAKTPWDGGPAVMPETLDGLTGLVSLPDTPADSLTLDAFSDLFG